MTDFLSNWGILAGFLGFTIAMCLAVYLIDGDDF